MPFYRSNYSSDESVVGPIIINRSPTELSDLFRSRRTKVVRIVEETPVRRRTLDHISKDRLRNDSPSPRPGRRRTQDRMSEDRPRNDSPSPRPSRRPGQEYTRVVHFVDESPSPPLVHRTTRGRVMTEESREAGFTPLPPKIKKSSSYDLEDDRGYDVEERAPGKRSSKSYEKKSSHKRIDSKMDHQPEFIEVPSSPRRIRESDAERARRKQAERDAARERALRTEAVQVATEHADIAHHERTRREEVEDLGRIFERAYIEEHEEAEAAKARADELAKQLQKEKRDKKYLERKTEILAREKRVAEETERIARERPVLRPVDLHQDPRPMDNRDPGTDAIRRAQEDARRRQQDESLFARSRRGNQIVYDDDWGRRGPRRE